ncbi:MAG TPA: DegQ family serine endoprotease, partial [Methylomirabilota bacterium]|nr:DegQ family serine endoprotease [Methylomirabilota bacterium]
KAASRPAPRIVLNTNAIPKDTRGVTSFAPVVKRVAPSVVTIFSTKIVRQSLGTSPFNDPLFRRFFGPPEEEEEGTVPGLGPRNRNRRDVPGSPREQKQQSLGSGVIVSADGYILSNNHVVEGADEVKIALSGSDDEYIAKVIGTDPQTDISVLKIEAENLQPVTMTDSDHLQVGDVVLAVGNPFGVGQTVTMGIVSATGRGRFGIVDYEDFIQTDAAINRGNSGGALVDAEGRLVGINTAIISPTGGSIGIGFAIPINMVRHVMDSIVHEGKVTRGYLGIQLHPEISQSMAKAFGLKERGGALVDDVMPNSPAGKAGFQPGDVITEFNGRRVPDSRQLRLWVSQTPPNTKVNLKVIRDGKEQKIAATLGELPKQRIPGLPDTTEEQSQNNSEALDGVEVTDLDARTRRQAGIPQSVQGALVTAVEPSSTAAEAGLRQGDVILEINRRKVRNAQEAIDMSARLKNDQSILLRVWSGGREGGGISRYVVVEPSKSKTDRDSKDK